MKSNSAAILTKESPTFYALIREDDVYERRMELGIRRTFKMVDTCAAEFEAQTLTTTPLSMGKMRASFRKEKDHRTWLRPNRIGQGIEFDYCCVHGVFGNQGSRIRGHHDQLQSETVSTDFDIADKLYFEPSIGSTSEKSLSWKNPKE